MGFIPKETFDLIQHVSMLYLFARNCSFGKTVTKVMTRNSSYLMMSGSSS